ncbi:MAG: hydroxymethylglutaryl-CoA lyase [Bacteroidia bacterium]|nr:hydroxymethylglutaryl-CoA lyase [Bacteroidia bacterium]
MIKLIECPRDAMQGLSDFIPTEIKINYINQLLKVGFDTLDFGSFVSPKAIPQLRDTAEVLANLDLSTTKTKLLAIIANVRGAEEAIQFPEIKYLGFPFSISETFQLRNTNATILESLERVKEIQNLCLKNNKELVVYISMAFGNPYGDTWSADVAINWVEKLNTLGINIISLADTTGVSTSENINYLFSNLIPHFKNIEFGAHLHSTPEKALEKIKIAYDSDCRRFDMAINGFGGCPMASDSLTGNIATQQVLAYLNSIQVKTDLNQKELDIALFMANGVFPEH